MKKKFLVLFVILAILTVSLIPASAIETSQEKYGGKELKQSIENDKEAVIDSITNAKTTISDEEKQALDDNKALYKAVVTKDKKGKSKYADFFAGSYIDDNENLVVQFTKDANQTEINNSMENVSDSADIEIVKYSYEDICSQHEKDSAIVGEISYAVKHNTATEQEKAVIENLISIGLSEKDNCNIVTLKKVTEKTKNDFINCVGDKNVIFKESNAKENIDCKTVIKPGSSFAICKTSGKTDIYYYGRSVGARMEYNKADGSTIYGFLTAGHCVDENGQLVYYKSGNNYVKFGKVSLYKYSGCADAAFLKHTNTTDFSTSRYTAYSNSKGGTTEKIQGLSKMYLC